MSNGIPRVGSRRFGANRLLSLAKKERSALREVEAFRTKCSKHQEVIDSSEASFSEKQLASYWLAVEEKGMSKAEKTYNSIRDRLSAAVSNDIASIKAS